MRRELLAVAEGGAGGSMAPQVREGSAVGVRTVLTSAAVLVLLALLGVAVHGALIGATMAAGEGWEIRARWNPVGSHITYETDGFRGGAGGLARPGELSEAVVVVPPRGSATYVVGVLPAGVETVRVTAPNGDGTVAATQRLVTDTFYVGAVLGRTDTLTVEAVDADGRVIDRRQRPATMPERVDVSSRS